MPVASQRATQGSTARSAGQHRLLLACVRKRQRFTRAPRRGAHIRATNLDRGSPANGKRTRGPGLPSQQSALLAVTKHSSARPRARVRRAPGHPKSALRDGTCVSRPVGAWARGARTPWPNRCALSRSIVVACPHQIARQATLAPRLAPRPPAPAPVRPGPWVHYLLQPPHEHTDEGCRRGATAAGRRGRESTACAAGSYQSQSGKSSCIGRQQPVSVAIVPRPDGADPCWARPRFRVQTRVCFQSARQTRTAASAPSRLSPACLAARLRAAPGRARAMLAFTASMAKAPSRHAPVSAPPQGAHPCWRLTGWWSAGRRSEN